MKTTLTQFFHADNWVMLVLGVAVLGCWTYRAVDGVPVLLGTFGMMAGAFIVGVQFWIAAHRRGR